MGGTGHPWQSHEAEAAWHSTCARTGVGSSTQRRGTEAPLQCGCLSRGLSLGSSCACNPDRERYLPMLLSFVFF